MVIQKRKHTKHGVVVLVSGRGSNLHAILESHPLQGKVSAVFSDNPIAPALEIAEQAGVFTQCINPQEFQTLDEFELALADAIEQWTPKVVVLAGFMQILSVHFVEYFYGRLLNIHPSLLPAFPGLDTHRKALESGATLHGCTVHWVDAEVDSGPIIKQAVIKVLENDSAETLASRILKEEHKLYPIVIADILAGKIQRK